MLHAVFKWKLCEMNESPAASKLQETYHGKQYCQITSTYLVKRQKKLIP